MKPGLYVATVRGTTGLHVWNDGSGDGALEFLIIEGPYVGQWEGNDGVTDARPLVVLDPESDEDRECLRAAMSDACPSSGQSVSLTRAAGATLRALAAPTPAEPMGLGAVAKDAHGYIWLRQDYGITPGALPWWSKSLRGQREWSEIESPEVLSEGWSA